jgi:hypothetical protein
MRQGRAASEPFTLDQSHHLTIATLDRRTHQRRAPASREPPVPTPAVAAAVWIASHDHGSSASTAGRVTHFVVSDFAVLDLVRGEELAQRPQPPVLIHLTAQRIVHPGAQALGVPGYDGRLPCVDEITANRCRHSLLAPHRSILRIAYTHTRINGDIQVAESLGSAARCSGGRTSDDLPVAPALRCSFCGLPRQRVIAGATPSLAFCDHCVALCVDIFTESGQWPPEA